MKVIPKTSAGDWTRWLENMQDWCISRQLWWGHRCPAYLIKYEGEAVDVNTSILFSSGRQLTHQAADDTNWVVARTPEEAQAQADQKAAGRKYTLEQDEDVLDTWFSSGLWPFSILGWPEKVSFLLEHVHKPDWAKDPDSRTRKLLPQLCSRDWMGYLVLLGRQDGLLWYRIHRSNAIQGGLLPPNGPRCLRTKNVEIARKRH